MKAYIKSILWGTEAEGEEDLGRRDTEEKVDEASAYDDDAEMDDGCAEYQGEGEGSGEDGIDPNEREESEGQNTEPGEDQGQEQAAPARFQSAREVDGHCVTFIAPDSYESGHYLRLRYAIEANREPGRGVVVGICSPAAGDGKSLTAINLAGALAHRDGSRVLLVDADLRRRSEMIRHLVSVQGGLSPGLSELVMLPDEYGIEAASRWIEQTNVWVLLTGSAPLVPYELFASPGFSNFIEQARNLFDYVILDAPPVVAVPDCKVLVQSVDSVVMVVCAHKTPKLMLEHALEILGPEKILGILLNRCDQLPYRYYRYYGKYGYATRARAQKARTISVASVEPRSETGVESAGDIPA